MDGTYEEQLQSAGYGMWRVTAGGWSIRYYFEGPTARHKGSFFVIPGEQVTQYIEAYRKNWSQYLALKDTVPSGGSFRKEGVKGMGITVGGFRPGVCIDGWNMPVDNPAELEKLLRSFQSCIDRAGEVMRWLKSV